MDDRGRAGARPVRPVTPVAIPYLRRVAERMPCALVLGGTGFIGSYVVQELLDHGWRVVVAGRRPLALDRERFGPERLSSIVGDLAATDALAEPLAGADIVVQRAHATIPRESVADPLRDIV
jgi:UDP-glucose 4-epimerase